MFAHATVTVEPRHKHHLGDAALVLAAIAVAPLILFAALWAAVLLTLGGMWLWSLTPF